ncbi:MAG TPA: hypothetical protein VF418_09415 [Sphingomonadaceae bacterium]
MTTNGPLSVVSPDPDVTNDLALDRLRESRGRALPELLPEVDRAAGLDPLDGRPLLFHALQRILAPGPNASPPISMLEASRRQNPRLVETRLLLLDAYGRTGQAGRAMDEAKALMALVPEQHALVVRLIAGLAGRPGGPEALERALPTSPVKGDVMLRLAQTGADRALLQRFAAAMRGVAHDPSARDWVGQLVSTVAQRPDPEAARALWATLYDVDPARVGAALADPGFAHLGNPPFGWSFGTGKAGIAGVHDGRLEVYYYGRARATFASQMLMLAPGNYRLVSKATSSDEEAPRGLAWTLSCVGVAKPLVTAPLPLFIGTGASTVPVSVPASGCAAQTLQLAGFPSDLPKNQSASIESVQIERAAQ